MRYFSVLCQLLFLLVAAGCRPIAPAEPPSDGPAAGNASAADDAAAATIAAPRAVLPTMHYLEGNQFDVGTHVFGIAVADLNGDMRPDLAVPDKQEDVLRVFLNDGVGHFGAGKTYAAGAMPNSVAAVDLDGDQDLDLAVANEVSKTVSIYANDGAGGFTAPVDYDAALDPWWIFSLDVNHDDHPDLAVSLEYDTVGLLINRGDGSFAPIVQVDAGKWGGNGSAAAADINGDGLVDIVTRNPVFPARNPDSMSTLANQGDGTFAQPVLYRLDDTPHDIVPADMNNDGAVDLVVPTGDNLTPGMIHIFYNDGSGSFNRRQHFQTGKNPLDVVLVDLDQDGDRDMLVASGSSAALSAMINDDAGNYRHSDDFFVGPNPDYVEVIDVDGDGTQEVLSQSMSGVVTIFALEDVMKAITAPASD